MTIDDPKNHTVIPELRLGKDILEDYIGNRDMNCSKEQIRDYYNILARKPLLLGWG